MSATAFVGEDNFACLSSPSQASRGMSCAWRNGELELIGQSNYKTSRLRVHTEPRGARGDEMHVGNCNVSSQDGAKGWLVANVAALAALH